MNIWEIHSKSIKLVLNYSKSIRIRKTIDTTLQPIIWLYCYHHYIKLMYNVYQWYIWYIAVINTNVTFWYIIFTKCKTLNIKIIRIWNKLTNFMLSIWKTKLIFHHTILNTLFIYRVRSIRFLYFKIYAISPTLFYTQPVF